MQNKTHTLINFFDDCERLSFHRQIIKPILKLLGKHPELGAEENVINYKIVRLTLYT